MRSGWPISDWRRKPGPLWSSDADPPRALVLIVPLTSQSRGSLYEVALPKMYFLDRDSVANVQGLSSLPTVRLERKIGQLPATVMNELRRAIKFALDLD